MVVTESGESSGGGRRCKAFDILSLPEDCIFSVISFMTPRDACLLSLVSSAFKSVADSDIVWDRFIPLDCQKLITPSLSGLSKKELYLALCDHPVLFDEGRKSFSLDKETAKKCFMLSARDLSIVWGDTPAYWRWVSVPESRFMEVAELMGVCWFEVCGKISIRMLSPMTNYGVYLVFKTQRGTYGFDFQTVEATVGLAGTEGCTRSVHLDTEGERVRRHIFQTRRFSFASVGRPGRLRQPRVVIPREMGEDWPRNRRDGWLEVQLGEFFYNGCKDGELEMRLLEIKGGHWKRGIIVEGIELRPKGGQ